MKRGFRRLTFGKPRASSDTDVNAVDTVETEPMDWKNTRHLSEDDSHQLADINFEEVQLGDKIGEGGESVVFEGTYQENHVAIKMLKFVARNNKPAVHTFTRELMSLRLCSHPNVVRCYGAAFVPPESYYIVTEYLSGGSLFEMLHRRPEKVLSAQRILDVGLHIAEGLHHLHQLGIIHRDLKSSNLLMDEHGIVKICDFGASRIKDEAGLMTGEVGSVRWTAPEVLMCTKYTEAADVFSFGVVMWELITGQVPYAKYSATRAGIAICQGELPGEPLDTVLCPTQLKALILRTLSSKPTARPKISDVATVLRKLGGNTVTAGSQTAGPITGLAVPAATTTVPASKPVPAGGGLTKSCSLTVIQDAVKGPPSPPGPGPAIRHSLPGAVCPTSPARPCPPSPLRCSLPSITVSTEDGTTSDQPVQPEALGQSGWHNRVDQPASAAQPGRQRMASRDVTAVDAVSVVQAAGEKTPARDRTPAGSKTPSRDLVDFSRGHGDDRCGSGAGDGSASPNAAASSPPPSSSKSGLRGHGDDRRGSGAGDGSASPNAAASSAPPSSSKLGPRGHGDDRRGSGAGDGSASPNASPSSTPPSSGKLLSQWNVMRKMFASMSSMGSRSARGKDRDEGGDGSDSDEGRGHRDDGAGRASGSDSDAGEFLGEPAGRPETPRDGSRGKSRDRWLSVQLPDFRIGKTAKRQLGSAKGVLRSNKGVLDDSPDDGVPGRTASSPLPHSSSEAIRPAARPDPRPAGASAPFSRRGQPAPAPTAATVPTVGLAVDVVATPRPKGASGGWASPTSPPAIARSPDLVATATTPTLKGRSPGRALPIPASPGAGTAGTVSMGNSPLSCGVRSK